MENNGEQILPFETVQPSCIGGGAATTSDGAPEDGRGSSLPLRTALHVSPVRTQVPESETNLLTMNRGCASEEISYATRVTEEGPGEKLLEPGSAQIADSSKSKGHQMAAAAPKSKTELPAEHPNKQTEVAEPAASAPTAHSAASYEGDSIVMVGNESSDEGQTLLPKMTIDVRGERQLILSADLDSVQNVEHDDCCFCDPCSYCYR